MKLRKTDEQLLMTADSGTGRISVSSAYLLSCSPKNLHSDLPKFVTISIFFMMNQDIPELDRLGWPASDLSEALEELARRSGLLLKSAETRIPPLTEEETPDQWMEFVCQRLGIEAVSVETPYTEIEKMLKDVGPAILRLPDKDTPKFLAILKGKRQRISVLAPDLSVRRIPLENIRTGLCHELEAPLADPIDQLLSRTGVPENRRKKARIAILREQLNSARIGGCWLLRMSPSENLASQILRTTVPRRFLTLITAHIMGQILMIFGWWLVGHGVFQEHFERAWLLAWTLTLFTGILFQVVTSWTQSLISVAAGGLFKQRLLYGILQLEPEEIRHQGAGQFLGRVMESEAVESLALGGGFIALTAVVNFIVAAVIMAMIPEGRFRIILLLGWTILTAWNCLRYFRNTHDWVGSYREMTNNMVERMVGHRTRLAQEDHNHWHDDEDRELNRYLKLSEKLDRTGITLSTVIPRGWMLLGLLSITYPFIFNPETPTELAIGLGGIMLGSQALTSFASGILSVVELAINWKQVRPLFKAASRGKEDISPSFVPPSVIRHRAEQGKPVVDARNIIFRYQKDGRMILENCSLQIYEGDRLLLEGPSGGGKSTLAALIAGLRIPESGILRLQGTEHQKTGRRAWRRKVVSAPQFHENHVLTETFAFNLLMGRRWPPLNEDLKEADIICRELGLGELIERMPAGFQQMVGESGWQLSHGEQSRLFIARALLQNADLVILDESFAALDPENLLMAVECVLRRARTVLVIAHP